MLAQKISISSFDKQHIQWVTLSLQEDFVFLRKHLSILHKNQHTKKLKTELKYTYIHYEAPKCLYVLLLVFHMRVLSSIQTFTLTGNHASFILFLWEWNNDFVSHPIPMVYFLMPESFFYILAWFYLQV